MRSTLSHEPLIGITAALVFLRRWQKQHHEHKRNHIRNPDLNASIIKRMPMIDSRGHGKFSARVLIS
jgi:hypothetical protein